MDFLLSLAFKMVAGCAVMYAFVFVCVSIGRVADLDARLRREGQADALLCRCLDSVAHLTLILWRPVLALLVLWIVVAGLNSAAERRGRPNACDMLDCPASVWPS